MSQKIKFFRVDQLPSEGEVGGVYFLKGENPTLWVYASDGWENYASGGESSATDLAGYAQISWVTENLNRIWQYLDWDSEANHEGAGVTQQSVLEVEVPALKTQKKSVVEAINEQQELIETFITSKFSEVTVNVIVSYAPTSSNVYAGTVATLTEEGGSQQQVELDANGTCTFLVPKGISYKVSLVDMPNYYRVVANPMQSALKTQEEYNIEVEYCEDDRFIVLSNGHIYTWNDNLNMGALPAGTTAEFIRVGNSVLEENNGVFYLPVKRMQSVLPTTPNWGGANDSDIEGLANATSYSSNTGEYDMERNTNLIIEACGTDSAAYMATQRTVTLNGLTFTGWLGTAEQYQQLLANNTELQGWLNIVGIGTNFFTSSLAGWTSSEYINSSNSVRARIIVSGSIQASPKVRTSGGISVLPFYKDIHKV